MKSLLLLACAAALAASTGCNRSGIINGAAANGAAAAPGKKTAEVQRIAHGQEVNLRTYVVPGRTTIFDFTSEYWPPCRALAPKLHQLHANRDDMAVVEVDLNRPNVTGIDWHSPVAQQYSMASIPAFKIYGPDGKLQAEGDEARTFVYGLLK